MPEEECFSNCSALNLTACSFTDQTQDTEQNMTVSSLLSPLLSSLLSSLLPLVPPLKAEVGTFIF